MCSHSLQGQYWERSVLGGTDLPDFGSGEERVPDPIGEPLVGASGVAGKDTVPQKGEKPTLSATPFVMGEDLPLVQAKQVAKIQRGEYVDMAKHVKTNMEAEKRCGSQENVPQELGVNQTNRCEDAPECSPSIPRENKSTPGVPDTYHSGGPLVWQWWLEGVQLNVLTAGNISS